MSSETREANPKRAFIQGCEKNVERRNEQTVNQVKMESANILRIAMSVSITDRTRQELDACQDEIAVSPRLQNLSHRKFAERSIIKFGLTDGLIVFVYELNPVLDVLARLWQSNTLSLAVQITSAQNAHTLGEIFSSNAECNPADEATKLTMNLLVARCRFEVGLL